MALKLVYSQHRQPVGIYDQYPESVFEGGYVGFLFQVEGQGYGPPTDTNKVTVRPLVATSVIQGYGVAVAAPTEAVIPIALAGIIDDSTTGSGYGTLLGSAQLTKDGSTVITQSTAAASGKVGLWIDAGIFATDEYVFGQLVPTVDDAVCGMSLYGDVTANGILTFDQPGANTPIANFIEFVNWGPDAPVAQNDDPISGSESLVSPADLGTFMVFRLKT